MRKMFLVCLILSLVFMMANLVSAADTSTVNGWVSDSNCGAKGASAGHEACVKKCEDKGAKLVVVTDTDKKVLTVDNPDVLKGHEGHHVAVTGTVTGDSIHVDSTKML